MATGRRFSKSAYPTDTQNNSTRPHSVEDVARTMTLMDKTYNSTLSYWFKTESHRHLILSSKFKIIQQEFWDHLETGKHALNWMMEDWSLSSRAELVGKLIQGKDWTDLRVLKAILNLFQGSLDEEGMDRLVGNSNDTTELLLKQWGDSSLFKNRLSGSGYNWSNTHGSRPFCSYPVSIFLRPLSASFLIKSHGSPACLHSSVRHDR